MGRRGRLILASALVVLVCAPAASASEIIGRNATGVKLQVNSKNQALVTFRSQGKLRRVLVWGAMNAIHPTKARAQVKFRVDYSGGYGTYKRKVWVGFRNTCKAYDGSELAWVVATCKARDGSYWALQAWQRMLPNYGLRPNAKQSVWELRISHWKGPLPELKINLNWSYRKFHHLYGSFTYKGKGVYGFKSTRTGVPLDTFGRNLYLDTFNSAYGPGWKRENSFLTHTNTGKFCYGFYRHGSRPEGDGERYRATIIGPGVLPDIYWDSESPGDYDPIADAEDLLFQREFVADDPLCKPL